MVVTVCIAPAQAGLCFRVGRGGVTLKAASPEGRDTRASRDHFLQIKPMRPGWRVRWDTGSDIGAWTDTRAHCQRLRLTALGLRASGFARSYEGSPAVHGDDDASLAQDRHRVAHGGVGDLVLFGETALAGELQLDLALGDPPLDVVRDLDVGVFSPIGINRTSGHMINLRCSLSCKNPD